MNITDSLTELMKIDGAQGACFVDYESGLLLGHAGGGVDLELAAAGNSEVVKAKMKTMKSLNINSQIEDILITLTDQFHIIRPAMSHDGLFIYLVLNRAQSNLALARRKVSEVEKQIELWSENQFWATVISRFTI